MDGPNITTITSNGHDPAHTGSLAVTNVEFLAFNPAADPTPHNGTIDVNGGTFVILGGNTPITIEAGATAEIDAAASGASSYAGDVTFSASTGTLALDQPTAFTGTIAGITGSGQVLDLAGFDAAHHTVTATTGDGSFNGTTTTLTVTDTTTNQTAQLNLLGNHSDSSWTVTSDGHGGANIVDPPAPTRHPTPVTNVTATAPNQTLTGTGAIDNFVFNFANVGQATITNFHADTDMLQFNTSMFANEQAILAATIDDGHGNAVISIDAHDSITLAGVTKAQLHQGDFHLV